MKEEDDASSFEDVAEVTIPDEGIVLDAAREVRVKLYMGQVYYKFILFMISLLILFGHARSSWAGYGLYQRSTCLSHRQALLLKCPLQLIGN
jgi:hypothetical protein